jgi:hypothetical protein
MAVVGVGALDPTTLAFAHLVVAARNAVRLLCGEFAETGPWKCLNLSPYRRGCEKETYGYWAWRTSSTPRHHRANAGNLPRRPERSLR